MKKPSLKKPLQPTTRSRIPMFITVTAPGSFKEATARRIKRDFESALKGTAASGICVVVLGDGMRAELVTAPPWAVEAKS
jgi:hypothetical protein